MQACLGHRETWSLAFAFQLRMFVPCDVQLHLPASFWTYQQGPRTSFARFANINADLTSFAKLIQKLLVNLATWRGVYRESA